MNCRLGPYYLTTADGRKRLSERRIRYSSIVDRDKAPAARPARLVLNCMYMCCDRTDDSRLTDSISTQLGQNSDRPASEWLVTFGD